uniref:Uncharacterized protein n=1 Tax=Anguilla anguilla TaxID=7936 RepID=A0A0E9TB27_ANGAN
MVVYNSHAYGNYNSKTAFIDSELGCASRDDVAADWAGRDEASRDIRNI